MEVLVTLEAISKSYHHQSVLSQVDLTIYDGEFLTLLGPSGCGKTTLLRLLAGFETPDHGRILLKNQSIASLGPERRPINLVFQSYALFPHMSVFNNIAFGLRCERCPSEEMVARVEDVLKMVQLEKFKDRFPHQLSGGQQQRVAIARAVVKRPLLLLLDEPLSALDYHLRRTMQMELKALQRRLGITFVLVTHDQEEALSLSDRVVVLNEGRIEQIGSPRDIYEEPLNLFVAQFVGESNVLEKTVLAVTDTTIEVEVAQTRIHFMNTQNFLPGDQVHIIIRPEDIKVWSPKEVKGDQEHEYLPGIVKEVIYRGSTVGLIVDLQDGQSILACEFFDEDDDQLEYDIGESVLIQWQSGWEVVLAC